MATFGEITSGQFVPMQNDARFVSLGGVTGQVLKKLSDDDSDYGWADDETAAGGNPFPVGSVFLAVVNTNPSTLLGYGTWEAFAAGRMLVGQTGGDTDFDVAEETGGAKAVTLTEAQIPIHTHVQDPHTHVQNPHNHNFLPRSATSGAVSSIVTGTLDTSSTISGANQPHNQAATAVNQNATAVNQNAGGGLEHTNMPPYIVVYMWKRTA